jgi:hypothetical protein
MKDEEKGKRKEITKGKSRSERKIIRGLDGVRER